MGTPVDNRLSFPGGGRGPSVFFVSKKRRLSVYGRGLHPSPGSPYEPSSSAANAGAVRSLCLSGEHPT